MRDPRATPGRAARVHARPVDLRPPAIAAGILALGLVFVGLIPADEPPRGGTDPAASWGGDHVGRGFPEYITGDECLFCHREIGKTWPENRHQLTVRPADPDDPALKRLHELAGGDALVAETGYLLGSSRMTRFLKRSREYGKLEVLSTHVVDPGGRGEFQGSGPRRWDAALFGDHCAGCHATAVDPKTRAFSALSLDCVTCHGSVDLAHTKDPRRVLLSKHPRDARVVASICGQCHLRGGRSSSTGLHYPNTFVAGDNLFRDFQVDFSDAAIAALRLVDQHLFQSARDAAMSVKGALDCLACHAVHEQSTEKHQQLATSAICATCHLPGTPAGKLREGVLPANRRAAHNPICGY